MDANEKSLILPFKRLLVRLSRELNTKDVGVLKYVAELGDAVAEDCDSCLDVFKQLERLEKITPNNLDFLKQFFEDIKRRDLISVIDEYLNSQAAQAATHSNEARSVRSSSLEERHGVTSVDNRSSVNDNNVSIQRNAEQTVRSRSLEERHDGEHRARCETDASRSLSYPCGDTEVKKYTEVSHQRDTQQTDIQACARACGVTEQNGTCVSVDVGIRNEPGSNTLSEVECQPSVEEVDGPEPDTASLRPLIRGSLAYDSCYMEQDDAVLPLIPSMKSVTITSTVFTHTRPVENCSGVVTLKNYQMELAEPGCQGSNCIICAPTGSGKTFTAGYICKTRRDHAIVQQHRFKCLFVVCIRNLIAQQRDALCQIMPESGIVCGMDDKLLLSEYFRHYDVVVATAQLFLNALKTNEMKISDVDMLIMDECHHTILSHPYNAIMAAYYTACRQDSAARLPQIIGLTASLGVGACEDNPQTHYIRICANLDCECITYVRREENIRELMEFNPRPKRDQIVPVEPRNMDAEYAVEVMTLMKDLMMLNEMGVATTKLPHQPGTQQFENWVVQIRLDADKKDAGFISAAAAALQQMNASLLVYKELRIRDSFDVLEDYFNDDFTAIPETIRQLYGSRRATLEKLANTESSAGDNAKLHKLSDLLSGLFLGDSDPRGILLTRTRLAVSKLVNYVHEQPQLHGRVFADKLVGQGQRDGTMTDIQQENTLRRFRADRNDPHRCNLLIATDVAQEGLNMPKCNFVIRYNFVSNEIGSVQSKGRARAPNSECYLIVDRGSVNERREYENLEKEYLMQQALADINELTAAELHARIATERERLWTDLQQKKQKKTLTSSLLDTRNISIHCRSCKARLCSAVDMRMRCNNYICIADDILKHVEVKKSQKRIEFRLDFQNGPVLCRKCGHKVGLEIEYKQGSRQFGYSLSKDNVMWRCVGENEYRPIKKWSGVPFRIEEELLFPASRQMET